MESKSKTPKYIHKVGEDEKLSEELRNALDRELEKSPDEIDTKKVDAIVALLDKIDGSVDSQEFMDKDEFAQKYLGQYISMQPKEDKKKIVSYAWMRVAAVFILVIIGVGACNIYSVRATSKNLFTHIKEKAYIIYFDVLGNSNRETEKPVEPSDEQRVEDFSGEIYDSWEELIETEQLEFKIPNYIPEGLEAQPIHLQRVAQNDIGVSRQYLNSKHNMRILIRTMSENGKWLAAVDELENFIGEKEINGFQVSFYQVEDAVQAMFQDEKFIYIIETNMEKELIDKIILEMR